MADKRRARQGSVGGNLTPSEARSVLALPVYAVLSHQAVPIFSGTSLAAPSGLVGIYRLPGRSQVSGSTVSLPVWINGPQWERAVVPVLQDGRWSRTEILFQSLQARHSQILVPLIGEALAQSFHAAGYGPLPRS